MKNESSELAKAFDVIMKNAAEAGGGVAPPEPLPSYGYGYDVETGTNLSQLRTYWHAIRKRLWMIIGLTLLATALTLVYVARLPDIYQAQARVQVDLENPGSVLGAAKGSSIIVSQADPAYFNTQLEILSSAELLRRVVKLLDLEHNEAFLRPPTSSQNSTWQSLLRMVGLGKRKEPERTVEMNRLTLTPARAARPDEQWEEVNRLAPHVASLKSRLGVTQIKGTRLIEITYTHPDPQVATKIVNTIADAFVLLNFESKTETNTSTGDFLTKRIAELQSQIRSSEERLLNYAKSNQILSLDASQNTVVERLAGLNRQLLEAENERKLAEATFQTARDPLAASAMAEGSAGSAITANQEKLAELRRRRAELLTENTEEWPEVKEIDQQLAALEKQSQQTRANAVSTITTNLETRYRQALAREQALRRAFEQQRTETLLQNEAAITYRIIQQEIETNKNLLDGLLQRAKENDVVMAGTSNNIHVNDYAPIPKSPIGPERLRTVFMVMILSLIGGVGLALFIEFFDDTVRSVEDVETTLQLPALAVIPLIGGREGRRMRLLPSRKTLHAKNGNGSGPGALLVQANPKAPMAEAYRQLRTSVLLSTPGRAPNSLLITSSLPSEGKTTTVVNTAVTLAQTGARVLAVDADMRRPRLHIIFDMLNGQGLSTILSSGMSEAEVLSLIRRDEESGIYVLTAGPIPPNPAELLGSEQMRRLVTTLEGTFTHVIIDSPPVASFTDGVIISTMVDGVLLVVHGGRSSRELVRRARRSLHGIGARIFGVVLNMVDSRHHDYYYYQHYYKSYYETKEDSHGAVADV